MLTNVLNAGHDATLAAIDGKVQTRVCDDDDGGGGVCGARVCDHQMNESDL